MTYARARLWLGITGVGTIVTWCVVLLALRAPARLLPTATTPDFWRDALAVATVLFCYAAVQGTFDFFGGHILPTEYRRTTRTFGAFFAAWLRGVVAHSAALLAVGLALIGAARTGGFAGTVAAFVGISVLLLLAQPLVATVISGIRYRNGNPAPGTLPVRVADSDAPYFTEGIVGLPGFERVVLPARWNSLPPGERAAILLRKVGAVRSGSRLRGLMLALGFNTAGFALSCAASGGAASVAGLVTTSLWFTLWSFAGLLALPTPSQNGVFEADRYARENGANADTLATVIRKLDVGQDDEPTRPDGIERIFHPIPSVERRLARLAAPHTGNANGAWHAARTAIYLSWAGMNLLSRAVHCNAGRPDAWVFLPSD